MKKIILTITIIAIILSSSNISIGITNDQQQAIRNDLQVTQKKFNRNIGCI